MERQNTNVFQYLLRSETFYLPFLFCTRIFQTPCPTPIPPTTTTTTTTTICTTDWDCKVPGHTCKDGICVPQCTPGICLEHAIYHGGNFIERQVTGTFHQCRCGIYLRDHCSYLFFIIVRKLCERTSGCCHWSWSRGEDKWCWLKMKKVIVEPGRESGHISGSKICTNQCEPGVCWEHANYPGGAGGDHSEQHDTQTFHQCRCNNCRKSPMLFISTS